MKRNKMSKGLFIVFEGIDGSGKTTHAGLLADYIKELDKYQDVLLTREPTWRSKELQERLKKDRDAFSDGGLMVKLFIEDRKIHTHKQIIPELEQRTIVLCDRYSMSTFAYQSAQGVPHYHLLELQKDADVLKLDLTFYFSVPAEIIKRRIKKRRSFLEKFEKNNEFINRLIDEYKNLILLSENQEFKEVLGDIIIINSNQNIDYVKEEISAAFLQLYEDWKIKKKK
ncbi:MAG TPA: dTMP kinase [Candidatus Nanoarchaeia archaeon]|nr:dTMP kinase [Candidatus Nanoarchaeia archaeon]